LFRGNQRTAVINIPWYLSEGLPLGHPPPTTPGVMHRSCEESVEKPGCPLLYGQLILGF
jgi:hypothetical protein